MQWFNLGFVDLKKKTFRLNIILKDNKAMAFKKVDIFLRSGENKLRKRKQGHSDNLCSTHVLENIG